MEIKTQLIALISNNFENSILLMIVLLLIVLLFFICSAIKLNRVQKRYQLMMRGMENVNLEAVLAANSEELRKAMLQVESLKEDCQRLDAIVNRCLQRVHLVRYNAFENTGSDLSFALAMLDSKNDGVVVSSLFGRNESRVYAKPIINGQSTYFLTEEEQQALKRAEEKK